MHLLGWHNPLPNYLEQAVRNGVLKVVTIRDKKHGEYELLSGAVKNHDTATVVTFK